MVTTQHSSLFALPFYHLSGDKIWTVLMKDGDVLKYKVRGLREMAEIVDYAKLNDDLFDLLQKAEIRNNLMNTLLHHYFPKTKDNYYKKNGLAGGFWKKVENDLLSPDSEGNLHYYDQIEDEEKFMRGKVFRKLVPKIYNFTCCITKMKVISLDDYTMVDACHIKPFNLFKDDLISNGLALCPNLHRAFDRGFVSIDENFKLIVSDSISEDIQNDYSFKKLEGKRILLPFEKKLYPSPEKIKWHRENVYKR